MEHLIDVGEQVKEVTRSWAWTSGTCPRTIRFPNWTPCPAFEEDGEEYDLFLTSSRLALHTLHKRGQPVGQRYMRTKSPLTTNILLNSETAARKGIEDGDTVCVESRTGKVKER